ncbi:YbaB/EbfC family nucleoid-associated protein [Spirillospora sp. NBC_01491]|uniref:YbaB/EbfC family nucleoid-associated protein n=1 Tax=Spirillospora sp. NBC_01491 TaxID=2976007 RepID=UPI002E3569D3|nr:YbaB/EbfC family nucleoid-associated protein [Spirillospora sp. NBC_01491]
MPEFSLGQGFERFQRDMEQNVGDFSKMQDRIKEALGKGEAADGRIAAEFRSEGGLTKLTLDPRVLRMGTEELSAEVCKAVNAASQDFQTQVRAAGSEMFSMGQDSAKGMDPAAALASLDKIANGFAGQMKDLARELGLQQQRAKEAMENYQGKGDPTAR